MIIKTEKFDEKFTSDLKWIKINQSKPLKVKGSYIQKRFGDPLTDIDTEALVFFNDKLLEILVNIFKKNTSEFFSRSPFRFVHVTSGRYDGYDFPWKFIKNNCEFSLGETHEWFKSFKEKSLVPQDVLDYIEAKLYADNMVISDLIDIQNKVESYAEILWNINDIERGWKEKEGKKYDFLGTTREYTPVIEYIYEYKDPTTGQPQFINIDMGLSQMGNRIQPPFNVKMYRYYTQDMYTIMKSFKWKMPEKYKNEYQEELANVSTLISIKYQLYMLSLIKEYNIYGQQKIDIIENEIDKYIGNLYPDWRDNIDQVENEIYESVNNQLHDYVKFYAYLLNDKSTLLGISRGLEAQIPTSQELIKKRTNIGIHCPFFSTDMEQYIQLEGLAVRVNMDPELLIKCVSQVALAENKHVSDVLKFINNNNYHIVPVGSSSLILKRDGNDVQSFSLKYRDALQIFILTYKDDSVMDEGEITERIETPADSLLHI